MDRPARLHLIGRITYYVGWIAWFWGAAACEHCQGAIHVNQTYTAESV